MKIIEFEGGQGSESWLQWRRSKVTATDAGIILGLNKFKDMHQLWQEKMGFINPEPPSEAMKRGSLLENEARELLSEKTGIDFQPAVIESSKFYWMGASLDGINYEKKVICEIKCMKLSKHMNVSFDTLDPCHFSQMQHSLACSCFNLAYFGSYHPDAEEKLKIIYVPAYLEYQKNMIEKEEEFYFETMCNMQPTRESFKFKEKVR